MHKSSVQNAQPASVELVDEAASVLRERIYLRRYPAGSRLRQEKLAKELGIGRTPIREALRILEQEGLVSLNSGQGARVVSLDIGSLIAAYEVRAVIDGLAARLAAERGPGRKWFAHLRRTIATQRRALDPWDHEAYARANVDFHGQVAHLSDNRFVIAQMSLIRVITQVFAPVALLTYERAEQAIAEHDAIVDAIENRDGDAAESLARQHIDRTLERLKAMPQDIAAVPH